MCTQHVIIKNDGDGQKSPGMAESKAGYCFLSLILVGFLFYVHVFELLVT